MMQNVTMHRVRVLSGRRGSGLLVVQANPKPQSVNTPIAPTPIVATKPVMRPGTQQQAAAKPLPTPKIQQSKLSKEQQDVAWARLQQCQQTGEIVEAQISGTNEKGAMVLVQGMRGFIPYSKLDPARLKAGPAGDVSFLVGQIVKAKILSTEEKEGKRTISLSERKAQQGEALTKVVVGSILSGVVTGIEDYGAFVSIAGMDGVNGLVFKDEVSWGKIITVDSMLKIGQKVSVKVLTVDPANVRMSLSIKQLSPDPLTSSLDGLAWGPCVHPEPQQISALISKLTNTVGITSVTPTRQLLDSSHVAQELEVYLGKQRGGSSGSSASSSGEDDGMHTLVARLGSLSTELQVLTTLGREEVKSLVQKLVR